jgi:hypothetical protein
MDANCKLLTPLLPAFAALAICISVGDGYAADKGSLGQNLVLKDEGVFFVNEQLVLSDFPNAGSGGNPPNPATFAVNQMFVHYRIPASNKHKVPIIMVHGSTESQQDRTRGSLDCIPFRAEFRGRVSGRADSAS